MKSEQLQWEEVKENYLKLIQQALAFVEHPRRTEILNNVKEHLERKYAELPPDKRRWESYQQIITEMGPPADYATLLCDDIIRTGQSRTGLYTLLGGLIFIALLAVGAFLIIGIDTEQPQTAKPQTSLFVLDPNVLGKWVAIDFVDTIEIFNPVRKSWQNSLYLKSVDFKKQGVVEYCIDENQQKVVHPWTKGKVYQNAAKPSDYVIKTIGSNTYLFIEWISGDPTFREEKPCYYALTQNIEKVPFNIAASAAKEIQAPAKESVSEIPVETQRPMVLPIPSVQQPAVLGKWIAVDYVRKADDFVPTLRQWQKTLILRELQFIAPATVYWSFNNNIVKQTSFTESTAETINGQSAQYTIKMIDGQEYLFIEWVTQGVAQQEQVPWYYVLKRERLDSAAQAAGQSSAGKSDVLGQWVCVDFVKTMDEFDPGRKSWRGSFYLTGLDFQNNNQVWFSFSNNNRFQHSWAPGKVETGESRPALYTIKNFDGSSYMFFEWISGDVTIRGQKPWYYVLKKTGTSAASAGRTANRKIIIGENYCTMNFVESQIGQAASKEARMLRYPDQCMNFWFSEQGVLSEVHYNQGYRGQLQSGISLTSTAEEVFRAYGKPKKTIQTDSLSKKNDEGILYQNGSTSRIYYGKHGLIFWFRDNVVLQIVVFEGEIPLIANAEKKPVLQTQSSEKNVFVVSFQSKAPNEFRTSADLLTAFNQNHPNGVRTHHYRTKMQNNQLIGCICVDGEAGVKAVSDMLNKSDTLELLNTARLTQAEFEAYMKSGLPD